MRLIFFDEETLQIKGMSDGDISMEYPYVQTDEDYHSLQNLSIQKNGEEYELIVNNN